MSTKAELREKIKLEARIKSTDEWDDLIDSIVLDILTDYCNLARYGELLLQGVDLPLADAQQGYDLPEDFANLAVLRFARGPLPSTGTINYRELTLQTPNIRQTNSNGYPFFYRRIGNKLSLWPYLTILATDSLLIDYYVKPESIFSSDSDDFPIFSLEAAVKKDAIARIQRVYSSNQEAQMMGMDGKDSFNASRGST